MPVLKFLQQTDAEAAHERVLNYVLVASNLGMPEDWPAVEAGPDGAFYIVTPGRNFDSSALNPDEVVAKLPSEAAAEAAEAQLSQAREVGEQLIDEFLKQSGASGINAAGEASADVLELLLPATLACQIGALHAARIFMDRVLATDEATRPGGPYASNAALTPFRNQIALAIGQPEV